MAPVPQSCPEATGGVVFVTQVVNVPGVPVGTLLTV
jgi:hypothetical protein